MVSPTSAQAVGSPVGPTDSSRSTVRFGRKARPAQTHERDHIADGKLAIAPEQRIAVRMAADRLGERRRQGIQKLREQGALHADAAAHLLDGHVRASHRTDDGAHHAPVVAAAHEKHAADAPGPAHRVRVAVQAFQHLLRALRRHPLVVRLERLARTDEAVPGRQNPHLGRRLAAHVRTVRLIHDALVELHGRRAGGRFLSGACEQQQRRCGSIELDRDGFGKEIELERAHDWEQGRGIRPAYACQGKVMAHAADMGVFAGCPPPERRSNAKGRGAEQPSGRSGCRRTAVSG